MTSGRDEADLTARDDSAVTAGDDPPGVSGPAGRIAASPRGSAAPEIPVAARIWTTAMVVLVAMLIAGLAVAIVSLVQVRRFDSLSTRRQSAVAVARAAVADLTTADYRRPQRYIDRLKAEATGRFLSLFTNSATGFEAVLVKGKVQTTGRVADVGVRRLGADAAQLTVLADVTVRNSQTPNGNQRVYRLSVWMIYAGSRWLVSNVEFVK